VVDPDSRVSVARIALPAGTTATAVYESLKEADLHVLPCGPFHWADQPAGQRYVRVALGRDEELIEIASARLRSFFGENARDA
jgi:aspartate/methionine/tyrosine aminotransferase